MAGEKAGAQADEPDKATRRIPDPGFGGDTGAAEDETAAALASYASDPEGSYRRTLAAMQETRLLVPVTAVLGEVERDESPGWSSLSRPPGRSRSSDMAVVLMRGRDGRVALLAFTGLPALQAWNPPARPVPVTLIQAARAAVQDGAAALVVDVGGPVTFVVEGEDLRALADGYRLVALGNTYGWAKVTP